MAARAVCAGGEVRIEGLVASLDGRVILRDRASGRAERPAEPGTSLAGRLLDRGGAMLLEELGGATAG